MLKKLLSLISLNRKKGNLLITRDDQKILDRGLYSLKEKGDLHCSYIPTGQGEDAVFDFIKTLTKDPMTKKYDRIFIRASNKPYAHAVRFLLRNEGFNIERIYYNKKEGQWKVVSETM